MNYDKTELNCFVQNLYDQKMQEGRHGHYETMFHCVHKAIERVATQPAEQAQGAEWGEDLPKCRDCADFGPICPNSGKPCGFPESTPAPSGDGERAELIAFHSEQFRKYGDPKDKEAAALLAQDAQAGDPNAPWLSEAHILCTDHGIPQGYIADRIRELRKKLDAQAGREAVAVYRGRRLTPEGTREFWGVLADGVESIPDGALLYTKPQPAAVPLTMLTHEQMEEVRKETADKFLASLQQHGHARRDVIDYGRAIIAKFCEVNGITAPKAKKTMVWECNECGSQEYTMAVLESDVYNLTCSKCGGDEWHKAEERR